MANRYSDFPHSIDKLKQIPEFFELQASDKTKMLRYEELIRKVTLSNDEIKELNGLNIELRDKGILADDWNALVGAVIAIQDYQLNRVLPSISDMVNSKEIEFNNFISTKQAETKTYIDVKKQEVTDFVNFKENEMSDKKDYFINLVKQKENQLSELDSRTVRYWQKWNAKQDGQIEFDIFINGMNLSLPNDAILNIDPQNIDVIVQGVEQTPYEDFEIKKDGLYRTIILKGNAASQIKKSTEVFTRYYKNVGKLYFKHKSTHEIGGSDPLIVYEEALEEKLKNKVNNSINLSIGTTKPTDLNKNVMWFNISI